VVLKGHTAPVQFAAFSPDGQSVVTASWDGTARMWRADGTGEPVVLREHAGVVTSATFSPDGQRLVTSGDDGTARVWRADGTGEPLVLQGHTGPVQSAAFSPDGRRLVTAGNDGTARNWPLLSTPELQRRLRDDNKDCLTPDLRETYLYESEARAHEHFASCERSHGRDVT
jgi:WD40 repeat protein